MRNLIFILLALSLNAQQLIGTPDATVSGRLSLLGEPIMNITPKGIPVAMTLPMTYSLAWLEPDGTVATTLYASDPEGLQTDYDFHVVGSTFFLNGAAKWYRYLTNSPLNRGWAMITETHAGPGTFAVMMSNTNGHSEASNVVSFWSSDYSFTSGTNNGFHIYPDGVVSIKNGGTCMRPTGLVDFGLYSEINTSLGTTNKAAAVIGLIECDNDVIGDKAYAGYFSVATAQHSETEVGVHVETLTTSNLGTIAEFVSGGVTRLRIASSGVITVALPVYTNNAAAKAGGLVAGNLYRTGGDPDVVATVH